MGYGAMQLAGPGVWGPPRNRGEAITVLREAVERGITHIDTSDYYGPHTVNELIREALLPYPKDLPIVTKVGARRATDKSWPVALSREELTSAVHDNRKHLGLETLDVVNLRVGGLERPTPGSIAEPFTVLAELRRQGLIRPLGVNRRFSVAINNYAAIVLAAPLVSAVSSAAPLVQLDLRPSGTLDVFDLLDSGELDVAIGTFAAGGQRFWGTALLRGRFLAPMGPGRPA